MNLTREEWEVILLAVADRINKNNAVARHLQDEATMIRRLRPDKDWLAIENEGRIDRIKKETEKLRAISSKMQANCP